MTITIRDFATRVTVGEPRQSGKPTLSPLFCKTAAEPLSYMLLAAALDSGKFEISEISESGSVNTVVITNMTGQPVLILDGEEIVGAKQKRMVNATILVAANKKTTIPVSCVAPCLIQ